MGWGQNLWDNYEDYLTRFSGISEEILLNIRGYHREVLLGEITLQQWREACKNGIKYYKKKFPKIKYIEALNEYLVYANLGAFPNCNDEFYKIINEVNNELKSEIPLLIRGPCDALRQNVIGEFFKNYVNDKDRGKRLDFISYHDHGLGKDPSLAAGHQQEIEKLCEENGLPTDIPIFIDEMGAFGGYAANGSMEEDQLIQAASMSSQFYFFNRQPKIQAFHWVIQHVYNARKNQIGDHLYWTPYGISLKMQAKMAETQIESFVKPGLIEGKGIYSLASKSDQKITVLVWNYQSFNGKNNKSSRGQIE